MKSRYLIINLAVGGGVLFLVGYVLVGMGLMVGACAVAMLWE